jgi:hypothetical protein
MRRRESIFLTTKRIRTIEVPAQTRINPRLMFSCIGWPNEWADDEHSYATSGAILEQSTASVILENLGIPDVAPQRVHALVSRLIGHLEDGGASRGSAGQEARSQRVTSK